MKKWVFPVLLLMGCNFNDVQSDINNPVQGFKPVYANTASSEISLLPPQTVREPGKIYIYEHYLLVNEKNRGIHIFDNTDKSNPQPIAFAEILGNSDAAIRNAVLYADHMGNLAALKINNFENFEQVGSLPINQWLLGLPPPQGRYFECVDPSQGVVIDWKEATIPNRNCYAHTGNW